MSRTTLVSVGLMLGVLSVAIGAPNVWLYDMGQPGSPVWPQS